MTIKGKLHSRVLIKERMTHKLNGHFSALYDNVQLKIKIMKSEKNVIIYENMN